MSKAAPAEQPSSSAAAAAPPPAAEFVFPWLRTLPVAPEYHPTLAEFQDPIAYIFKIEKEAARYGICKIVPPLPPAPRKTVVSNFNKSISSGGGGGGGNGGGPATFTTRQQQIGFCPRRSRPVQRPVWQSGEYYTFQEFETKAKAFERNYLKRCGKRITSGAGLTALEIETIYWKATVDKPFAVEYANDMPGSAFGAVSRRTGEGMTVGDTAWNMKGVARSAMSLLRFMKEDIAGVTSPMVYVAMMFSWFAWHVEDHDLHSLNYLHTGAGKTWYGVPKEAAAGFEEVVRVDGYAGEINPLVAFATLGEKTTVMSPEVFIKAGIPCCRLVQNPGEFVVTFPRAYHSGFSHGFNCGDASNIATPEWLAVAKEAAIRRASINYPPMVSHFQLLYDLVFALCSRLFVNYDQFSINSVPGFYYMAEIFLGLAYKLPVGVNAEPRSSRLKQKKKAEGETVVKQLFVEDIKASNELLNILGEGLPVVLRPQSSAAFSIYSKSRMGGLLEFRTSTPLGQFHEKEATTTVRRNLAARVLSDNNDRVSKPLTLSGRDAEGGNMQGSRVSDQKLFSCVTCGILCFSCFAIIQPNEDAARCLMSSDCSSFNDYDISSGITSEGFTNAGKGWTCRRASDGMRSLQIQSSNNHVEEGYQSDEAKSDIEKQPKNTALDLLASAYGNSSDSEDDRAESDPVYADGPNFSKVSPDSDFECDNSDIGDPLQENNGPCTSSPRHYREGEASPLNAGSDEEIHYQRAFNNRVCTTYDSSSLKLHKLPSMGSNLATMHSDRDSSKLHIFCLEHAVEVKKKLDQIGGVNMLLLCHPDYPKVEAEARSVIEELGLDHCLIETVFRKSTENDDRCMDSALESAEDVSGNGDWAVKLGINLFYSASLSRSPLYSKQMPYNSIVYKAFGRVPPSDSIVKSDFHKKGSSKRKRNVVAGKWCGKAWMSNQVHPLLLPPDQEEVEQGYGNVHASGKVDAEDPDDNGEIKSDKARRGETIGTTSSEAIGKKRQIVVYSRSNKKAKLAKTGKSAAVGDPIDVLDNQSYQQPKLYYRTKRVTKGSLKPRKEETPKVYYRSKNKAKPADEEIPLCDWHKYKPSFEPFGAEEDEELEGGPSTRLRKKNMKPQLELKPKPAVTRDQKQTNTLAPMTPVHRTETWMEDEDEEEEEEEEEDYDEAEEEDEEVDVRLKRPKVASIPRSRKRKDDQTGFQCNIEGCTMTFSSKQELLLHKRNICPFPGCAKVFFSHKYLLQHRRVHVDDRPLKCPWKGCKMTFKWAWARTEHIRVHTGVRPYLCAEPGCGQTFRFVSDFSRHKRKTGHSVKKTIKY